MAKKSKANETAGDPLSDVDSYDPDSVVEPSGASTPAASEPVSPLGPPTTTAAPGLGSIELLLREANRRIEQLQAELETEREQRRALEREHYRLEASAAREPAVYSSNKLMSIGVSRTIHLP